MLKSQETKSELQENLPLVFLSCTLFICPSPSTTRKLLFWPSQGPVMWLQSWDIWHFCYVCKFQTGHVELQSQRLSWRSTRCVYLFIHLNIIKIEFCQELITKQLMSLFQAGSSLITIALFNSDCNAFPPVLECQKRCEVQCIHSWSCRSTISSLPCLLCSSYLASTMTKVAPSEYFSHRKSIAIDACKFRQKSFCQSMHTCCCLIMAGPFVMHGIVYIAATTLHSISESHKILSRCLVCRESS